ncbi:ABC transporter permease [Streptomyces tagetis]|uniref:ABC transporter permease n=1 Tax=Streptomyces tagetis TaxID=2820809 RepID=A0A940XWG1_9ACTN|nr:ABC transporter permease [Streptomyces sp. RG38]MBQ0830798.1 ABC transporter permease [Streptomyces sp. RG38]
MSAPLPDAPLPDAPPATADAPPGAGPRAVLALARFEARRLLLTAPVLLAFAGYALWIGWRTPSSWDGHPALQDVDRAAQGPPLLVGLAVLLGASLGVLRSHRHGTEEHFGVLPLTPWRRTVAHLLSVVPAALLTAVGVAVQFGWEALKPGAVGHGSPAELAVGPLSVLLFGAAGVLSARLARSPLAAPGLVVVLLGVVALGAGPDGTDGLSWLAPSVATGASTTFPSELLGRPAAWHVLYLAGLALTVALLAVFAAGGRTRAVSAGLALSLAAAVAGGTLQARGAAPSPELTAARERATLAPEKEQTCLRRGTTTYCAFPEWEPRTATWAAVVDRVRSRTGGPAREAPLLVRQRVEARYGPYDDSAIPPAEAPHQVTVGTSWGGNRVPEFSTAVAAVFVAGSESAGAELCDGRMVTVMWLSLSWQDDPVDALRRVRVDDSLSGPATVLAPTEPLSMTAAQTKVVRELLESPPPGVAERVREHWAELTAPGVTTAHAAGLLGASAPAPDEPTEEGEACEA